MSSPTTNTNLSQPAIFLDRDGVLNVERGEYTFRPEDFEICEGVPGALQQLKAQGFLLIVVTNQGGIAKGLYSKADMEACHQKLQQQVNGLIDHIYYSPDHPSVSASLSRKPGSLLLEKAAAKFDIDLSRSYMIGDQPRDIEAAARVGVRGIKIGEACPGAAFRCESLPEAARWVLEQVSETNSDSGLPLSE